MKFVETKNEKGVVTSVTIDLCDVDIECDFLDDAEVLIDSMKDDIKDYNNSSRLKKFFFPMKEEDQAMYDFWIDNMTKIVDFIKNFGQSIHNVKFPVMYFGSSGCCLYYSKCLDNGDIDYNNQIYITRSDVKTGIDKVLIKFKLIDMDKIYGVDTSVVIPEEFVDRTRDEGRYYVRISDSSD